MNRIIKTVLALLISLLQGSMFLVSAQPLTTSVYCHGKVLSEGKGISNVPVTDGTQIVYTNKKGEYALTAVPTAEYIYITLPDGYNVPMKNKVPNFFHKIPKNS